MYEPLPPENLPQVEPDEVNVGLLGVVGTFLAVVVVLIVVLIQAWFYNWRTSIVAERTLPSDSPDTPLGRASWNSGKPSAATIGSTGRQRSGRSPSAGRWNWWPRNWPRNRGPPKNPQWGSRLKNQRGWEQGREHPRKP